MKGHLQVYSCYSFQDSTITISDLCKKANQYNFQGLALTDTNLYGAMEFMKETGKYHLKPIYGLTCLTLIDGDAYPLVLLAKDLKGYYGLVKLSTKINLSKEGYVELSDIKNYQNHLFVLSALENGIVERSLLINSEVQAIKYLQLLKEEFKENFYICIQEHDNASKNKINQKLVSMANVLDINVCCSNEVRILEPEDSDALELLQAIDNNRVLSKDFIASSKEKYFKDSMEMDQSFSQEIIRNTDYIFDSCNVVIPTGIMHLPKYPLDEGIDSHQYLVELCKIGLKKRFNHQKIPVKYIQRLQYELQMINQMKFSDYFLIVFDYVRFAKKKQINVGPGRGSAAGSLVAYVLGITNIDPIKYDLLFERFLNPERVSMPDIDIDFQDDRRNEVVEYVIEKYGSNHVSQIVTFNSYGPRVAIKDLGKVVGFSLPTLERISKYIPTNPKQKKTIKEVYETSNNFQNLVNHEEGLKRIIKAAIIVEKLPKNISQHAAGVVLCEDELEEVVPLARGPRGDIVTQYSKNYIEDVGLLKMDFLGIRNLTIISYIIKDININYQNNFKINDIPFDDYKTFETLANGDTFGIFQLESSGMTNVLVKLKTDSLNDIVAALALYRPGPMKNIGAYIARKQGKEKVEYLSDKLKPILESTYGIIIYQEQIMQIVQVVAGFSLAKADILRKAMSYKDPKLIASLKNEFLEGAMKNNYSNELANKIYDLIAEFANYGFNKSHSVSYSIVAYQLAYLKTHYPLEFICGILSNDQASKNVKLKCIQESKRYGFKILLPSINKSIDRFIVEEKNIRFSLIAIKGIGSALYQEIIQEREKGFFKDIADFLERLPHINSNALISLIKAGAFDEFGYNRTTIIENIEKFKTYAALRNLGTIPKPLITNVPENKMLKLKDEEAVLDIYLSDHPLVLIKEKYSGIIDVCDLENYVNKEVQILLTIQKIRRINDKKGNEMCFIEGNDETGDIEGVIFASVYQNYKNELDKANTYLIRGKINYRDKISLLVNQINIVR